MSSASFQCQANRADTKSKGMTPREIRAEMVLKNITIKQIADKAGVTSGAVTQTIYQYEGYSFKGYRIRELIAEALGKAVMEIWPEAM